MLRRLLVCLVVGLCAAPAAFAAGPDPGVVLGGLGVAPPGGKLRYVAPGQLTPERLATELQHLFGITLPA